MNKKIIISLGAAALLASSLLALPPQSYPNSGDRGMYNQGKNMSHKHHKRHGGIMKTMMRLDLSKEQRAQVREIFQKNRQNAPKMSMVFTNTSFNKAEYIKLQQEKRANKIQRKAETISAVYSILTPAQKQLFKAMLVERENKKGEEFDKNCDDRR